MKQKNHKPDRCGNPCPSGDGGTCPKPEGHKGRCHCTKCDLWWKIKMVIIIGIIIVALIMIL